MIFLLVAAYVGMVLYEVPGFIRNRYKRELVVYSFLIALAFVLSVLQMLDIKFPNPVRDTQYFVKNLLHLSYD